METDRLVDDYLRRLESAAAHLQASRRSELVAQIREHLEAALRAEDAADEAAVRNVLERLGPPEDIVEEAEEAEEAQSSTTDGRAGWLEITALVVLLGVPFVGWLAGAALAAVSRVWAGREKVIGIALALLPLLLSLATLVIGPDSGSESATVGGPRPAGEKESSGLAGAGPLEVFFVFLVGGLPSALYLGSRLLSRPGDRARTR